MKGLHFNITAVWQSLPNLNHLEEIEALNAAWDLITTNINVLSGRKVDYHYYSILSWLGHPSNNNVYCQL